MPTEPPAPATPAAPSTPDAAPTPAAPIEALPAPTTTIVNLGDAGVVPPGYRVAGTGNIIPESMHSSSQSARKVYVEDGKELAIPRSQSPLPATAVAPAALATIAPIHPVAAGESGLLAFTVGAPVRMYMGRAAARGRASARPRGHSTSTKSISIHHSQSSQSISIYDREIGAKISVSVSISRFLRLDNDT